MTDGQKSLTIAD